jgi:hypothetical protein
MANMSATRRTAFVAGVFFLATEVTAIPALLLYQPVLRDWQLPCRARHR